MVEANKIDQRIKKDKLKKKDSFKINTNWKMVNTF